MVMPSCSKIGRKKKMESITASHRFLKPNQTSQEFLFFFYTIPISDLLLTSQLLQFSFYPHCFTKRDLVKVTNNFMLKKINGHICLHLIPSVIITSSFEKILLQTFVCLFVCFLYLWSLLYFLCRLTPKPPSHHMLDFQKPG